MAAAEGLAMLVVDAFTDKAFGGNPAAVCLVGSKGLSDQMYQNIAMEMNLSETAFIIPISDEETYEKGSRFHLRWFTPICEVPLCGHATLGSAAVLFYHKGNNNQEITFDTLSGPLKARRDGPSICLDMPLNSTDAVPEVPIVSNDDQEINQVVKLVIGDVPCEEVRYSKTTKKLLVRLRDTVTRKELEGLAPDPRALLAAHNGRVVKGVCVTIKGSKENGSVDSHGQPYDFISRYFAPWNGIPEDPVTGSAHTVLGSYWSSKLGKTKLYARQCSSRGGELRISVREDGRIDLFGRAVIVLKGTLSV